MAVTVKTVKKKKPLSLKKGGGPADGEAPEGAEGAEGAPAGAAAPAVAAGPSAPTPPVKKASYTFAGICAILIFLMFAAVLTLQILEWKFYHDPPKNAFPPFGIGPEQIPIPGGSGVSSAPVATDDDVGPLDTGEDVPEDGVDPLDEGVPVE